MQSFDKRKLIAIAACAISDSCINHPMQFQIIESYLPIWGCHINKIQIIANVIGDSNSINE
jgi:hypothetical protein